jgi:hypothetical protein
MNFKKLILVLLLVVWISVSVATVIPNDAASHASYLGYKAVCPFAPFSTIIGAVAAAITYVGVRKSH